jgi:hypothetical protein
MTHIPDLVRMRHNLNLDAVPHLRVILDPLPSGKLTLVLECVSCEDPVEFDAVTNLWQCVGCEIDFRDEEVSRLLSGCAAAFAAEMAPETLDEPVPDPPVKDEGVKSWLLGQLSQRLKGR